MQDLKLVAGEATKQPSTKAEDETKELLRGILAELKSWKSKQAMTDVVEGVVDGSTAARDGTELQEKDDSKETTSISEINPFVVSFWNRLPGDESLWRRAKYCQWVEKNPDLPRKVTFFSSSAIAQMYKRDIIVQVVADQIPLKFPVRFEVTDAHRKAWTKLVGDVWKVPADGRLPLSFQQSQLTLNRRPFTYKKAPILPNALKLLSDGPADVTICDYVNGFAHFYEKSAQKRVVQVGTVEDHQGLVDPETKGECHEYSEECYSAPWQRIVSLRGLERSTLGREQSELFRNSGLSLPVDAIDCYMYCRTRFDLGRRNLSSSQSWLPPSTQKIVYLAFYEISGPRAREYFPTGAWKSGPLHSDERTYWPWPWYEDTGLGGPEKRLRVLRERAYAIIMCTGDGGEPRCYWTLLELTPRKTCKPYEDILEPNFKSPSARCDVLLYLLYYVHRQLSDVLACWEILLAYFNYIIDVNDAYFHPDQHDKLLTDDDTFSRSKIYFWAITTLKEIDKRISDNICELSELIDSRGPSQAELEHKTQFEIYRARLADRVIELQQIAERFRVKRLEAIDLRDGLFNASAVIDSRASIRQSENIKLLTFVSIFFLPLSFCMAVWSINNEIFSLNALKVTAVTVSLSTYLAVINLNNLAQLFRALYRSLADHLIGIMTEDSSPSWKQRGILFRKYTTEQALDTKPSDWRLIQYAFGIYTYRSSIWSRVRSWTPLLEWMKNQEDLPVNSSAPRDTTYRIPAWSEFRKTFWNAKSAYTSTFVPPQLRLLNASSTQSSTRDNNDMENGERRASGTVVAQQRSLQQDIELNDLSTEPIVAGSQIEALSVLQNAGLGDLDDPVNQRESLRVSHEVQSPGGLEPSAFMLPESSSEPVHHEEETPHVPSRGDVLEEREENGERSAVI